METPEIIDPQIPAEPKGLLLSPDAQYALKGSAKWAKFLAIMGYIGAALVAVASIYWLFAASMSRAIGGPISRFGAGIGVLIFILYIVGAAVAFILSRHLYRYADDINVGVDFQSTEHINNAMVNLHSFFKMKGIVLIVVLSLYLLIIIGIIIAMVIGFSMFRHSGGNFS